MGRARRRGGYLDARIKETIIDVPIVDVSTDDTRLDESVNEGESDEKRFQSMTR